MKGEGKEKSSGSSQREEKEKEKEEVETEGRQETYRGAVNLYQNDWMDDEE